MRNCGNCKFWDTSGIDWPQENNDIFIRKCKKAEQVWDATMWSDEAETRRILKPEFSENKAFVRDGSDYMAQLLTKAEFLCREHENRNSAEKSDGAETIDPELKKRLLTWKEEIEEDLRRHTYSLPVLNRKRRFALYIDELTGEGFQWERKKKDNRQLTKGQNNE